MIFNSVYKQQQLLPAGTCTQFYRLGTGSAFERNGGAHSLCYLFQHSHFTKIGQTHFIMSPFDVTTSPLGVWVYSYIFRQMVQSATPGRSSRGLLTWDLFCTEVLWWPWLIIFWLYLPFKTEHWPSTSGKPVVVAAEISFIVPQFVNAGVLATRWQTSGSMQIYTQTMLIELRLAF